MTVDHARQPASRRRGFSLIELMIAVMILGLGMVMVATVFPVSLDMTRETLQMHIANAAVDAAIETLKLKVPALENLETVDTGVNLRVRFPNALVTDVDQYQLSRAPIENDAAIGDDADELSFYNSLIGNNGPLPVPGGWVTVTPPPWLRYSTTFTEASFWDAEMALQAGVLVDVVRANTWVVPSQNMLSDTKAVVPDVPPYIDLSSLVPPAIIPQALPRVQLLDRVYPPLAFYYNYATPGYEEPDTQDTLGRPKQVSDAVVLQRVAEQRYAWHVIHSLSSFYQGSNSLLCTIVVTHRGDLNARYAMQGPRASAANPVLRVDLANASVVQALRAPRTAGPAGDTVFPQPWLVVLDGIVPSAGTVACTPVIARMLPVGSYFIIARTDPNGAPAGFEAGSPHKVIGNNYEPGLPTTATVTLQIARSAAAPISPVAVWVFPPPIRSHGGPWFEARSPVVGAFIREVTP